MSSANYFLLQKALPEILSLIFQFNLMFSFVVLEHQKIFLKLKLFCTLQKKINIYPIFISPQNYFINYLKVLARQIYLLMSVHQWSGRPGFNPTSCHTKDFKNST